MSEEQLSKKERKELKKQEQEANRQAQADATRAQKKKTITIVAVSAVVIVGFLFWLIQAAPERPDLFDETPTEINAISETDNVKGASDEDARITIVEYSDFECPACGAYYPVVKKVMEDFGDEVQFVYRHLPIRSIHPNAELAARYAEAAGLQGKFFEMHDMLFEKQEAWSGVSTRVARGAFEVYGQAIGLDVEKLREDATSDEVVAKIENQRIDGVGAGVRGTPTFFVNGEMLSESPYGYEGFVEIITGEKAGDIPASIDVEALEAAIKKSQDSNNIEE